MPLASTTSPPAVAPRVAPPPFRRAHTRWTVCALLFFATTVNYIDRLVFGLLAPDLQRQFGWSNADYADIVFWFEAAYALGLVSVGRLLDWVGTRRGFSVAVVFWSLATMLHAGMQSVAGFSVARFLLGLGEAANFPAAIKTVAEWFPKGERALATGIFNAGCNLAAIATPLLVPIIVVAWGWQASFIVTGALGFVWLVFWLRCYRAPENHPKVSAEELVYIRSDPPEDTTPVSWRRVLPHRQTWAILSAKFLTDAIWRWYLYLLPVFFHQQFKLDLKTFGPPFVAIYLIADVGSIGGGWLSSFFLKRGFTLNASRKLALLICALCVLPVSLVTQVESVWTAVLLVGLAAAAHQGWAANAFTVASDMFPKQAVGTITGLGSAAGAIGGMLILKITSLVLGTSGDFGPLFLGASVAYLVALAVFHLLAPRLAPVSLQNKSS